MNKFYKKFFNCAKENIKVILVILPDSTHTPSTCSILSKLYINEPNL